MTISRKLYVGFGSILGILMLLFLISFFTSQRGLRGIVKSIRKNRAAGSAETPSFQRHSVSRPN